jgi:hypothetical protein
LSSPSRFLVPLAGLALLVFVVLLRPSSAPERQAALPTPKAPAPAFTPPPMDRPTAAIPTEGPLVGRALDASNVRQLARTLARAAASGDASLERSSAQALKRYGASAKSVLEDEARTAANPQAARALRDLLSEIR